ncbi:hypothetical protein [Nannocystis sp. SCPEA4]|uniref:hypothetical protein n=1 Tax=Nannocystis sp. SCPEA4 TaxID=2996787 RepID=UPI00226F59D4|nr:hypothetical protein [Nannocystis sp. SCPEA4]MCY1058015.1 hypothetical protein [Nannocystis sp. SCPEA4]
MAATSRTTAKKAAKTRATKKPGAKATAVTKKTAAPKAAAKPTTAKPKPAARQSAEPKATTAKQATAANKPSAKKPASRKTAVNKPNAKKSAAKTTAANKPGAEKTAAKKPTANKRPNTATAKRAKATRAEQPLESRSRAPSSSRQLFMFSYHEHDWDENAFKNSGKERLRRAQTGTWTAQRVARSSWDNYCEVDSLAALRDQVRGFLVDRYHAPARAAELPLATLRRMLDQDGWSFVGGRFLEFEGNHNDTTIYALLARP